VEILQTLEQMKSYLGIEDNSYDNFLIDQGEIISSAIETYCRRSFKRKNYTQTFYKDELLSSRERLGELRLYHYPIVSVASIFEGSEEVTDYRVVKDSGIIRRQYSFFTNSDEVTIQYSAGFNRLPPLLREVFYTLLNERYSKKQAGVDLSFGKNVQRVSIPGTISIDYDYTLDTNNRNTALGVIIGDNANVLDQFVSERTLIGSLREGYVY